MNPFWTVSLFWIATVACVAVALAFVLPPLLRRKEVAIKAARRDINIAVYRDQLQELEADRARGQFSDAQFQAAKIELEGRLAEDALAQADSTMSPVASRRLGFTLAAVLPIAAFGLYFWLGNPMSLVAIAEAQANAPDRTVANAPGGHDFAKMVKQLEAKVQAAPQDGQSWTMLAKSYAAMERWPEAAKAFATASKLLPQDPSIMTSYAEAVAIVNNRVLKGQPMELVYKALEINPNDAKGLELAAINAFQDKNYSQAAFYFKHLLKQLPPESPYAQDIQSALNEAKKLAESPTAKLDNLSEPAAAEKPEAAVSGASIKGKLDIAGALKAKANSNDVVFLFARGGEGGPPVAAIRSTVGQLPLEFDLSDAMAMNPDNKLSNFKEVTLAARVAKSGQPMGAAGDFEGSLAKVKVGANGVKLTIDKVRQ